MNFNCEFEVTGWTPLLKVVAVANETEIQDILQNEDIDINLVGSKGDTPLIEVLMKLIIYLVILSKSPFYRRSLRRTWCR